MIFVERSEEPASLKANKIIWLENYLLAIENYEANPTNFNKKQKLLTENKYRQQDIKTSLKTMFEGKCAYCESHLAHVSYGHIEHFKPKSSYPEDCFNWQNLLLGCEICNGTQYK
jgi:5-methylcytosine-specific restriction endonuclease McrA